MGRIEAVKGTYDVLPAASHRVEQVLTTLTEPLRTAGYALIDTPVFESTELFARGVGETTDVVSKEMFTFTDKGGRSVTLRPEGTVGVVRAVLEAGLDRGAMPLKLRYSGQMFRYEQPQAGRQRQFTQVGAEALGTDDPALDAELIELADRGFRTLGLTRTRLLLNSLGNPTERETYTTELRQWLQGRVGGLDAETDRRIALNPLRVLDDKRPDVIAKTQDAPLLGEHLGDGSRAHHEQVRSLLTALEVPFEDAPRLVRGLDYYRQTTFEFVHPDLGAQSSIGGGGRYDGLSEMIGGPALPGVGWGLGVERVLLAMAAELGPPGAPAQSSIVVAACVPEAVGPLLQLVTALRKQGVAADALYGSVGRSPRKVVDTAAKRGATTLLLVGEAEAATGSVAVRDLVNRTQEIVPLSVPDLIARLTER